MVSGLSKDEKTLLHCLRSLKNGSVVLLRAKLAWDVPRFATVIIALQERELLIREGVNLVVTSSGVSLLKNPASGDAEQHSTLFAEQNDVAQLPVGALYLPDHNRFLRALQRSLYTHGVSCGDPE